MKKRKVSKKLKSSWRKNIDDTDVDEFFEGKRLDERLGWVFLHTLSANQFDTISTIFNYSKAFELRDDAELFTIQKKPQNLIRDSILCPTKKEEPTLRCYQALENTSAVPDPLIKRFLTIVL